MQNRFASTPFDQGPATEDETISALVRMLTGIGLDKAKVDALIDKSRRPPANTSLRPANGGVGEERRRSA